MIAIHMYQELDEKVPPKATAISANWTARLAKRILSDLGSPKRERKDMTWSRVKVRITFSSAVKLVCSKADLNPRLTSNGQFAL